MTGILVAPTVVVRLEIPFADNDRLFVGERDNTSGTPMPISSVVLLPSYLVDTGSASVLSLMYVVSPSPAPSSVRPGKVFKDSAYPDAAS